MGEFAAVRSSNRLALATFVVLLVLLVGAIGLGVASLQARKLSKESRADMQNEIALLGDMAVESLLRSDLAAVERLAQTWLDRHDYLVQLKAQMPNGFVLADLRKQQAAAEPLTVEHAVVFNGRTLMTLHAVGDFSVQAGEHSSIVLNASLASVMLILLIGAALWEVLQRTAVRPLEAEIASREAREEELRLRTVALEAAIKELEAFSYSVSHDLRGPLRAIDGFTQALGEDYAAVLDDTARQYIGRTRAAAQRMGLLIDDLLALARMSRQEVTPVDLDLGAVARATLARLAQAEPQRQVSIEVAAGLRARADAGLTEVLFDNLLGNAWKYTSRREGARIEFGSREEQGETVYFVRDNGAGFDMAYARKLFRPFQRLHGAEFEGTGIGLATVQRIVRRSGGRIWAEAAPGQGATFFFTLGRAAGAAARPAAVPVTIQGG